MSAPEFARERPLPASEDSERSILGAILLDNNCYGQTEGLTAEDFSLSSHKRIWGTMTAMFEDKFPVDIITLSETMRSQDQLEEVGGVPYLASLTDGVPGNIAHYVRIVKEKSQRRALIFVANNMIVSALEPGINLDKTLGKFQEQVFKIAASAEGKEQEIFSPMSEFVKLGRRDVEWRVERVIEKGTNGVIQALPKTGKSMAVVYLAACLATGSPWFDLDVSRCRVALISREDYAGTTARRLRRILTGMGLDPENNVFGNWLYINSREQSKSMMLDNPSDLKNLIKNLQRKNSEFAIFDVFNVLHNARNENDAAEMTAILNRLKLVHSETGAQVCVVHHVRKGSGDDSISERGRGTSAINGFAEFIIDMDMASEEKEVRQARFLTKAAGRYAPFHWGIKDLEGDGGVRLERVQFESTKRRAATA